jgi:ribosomal protein S27AE
MVMNLPKCKRCGQSIEHWRDNGLCGKCTALEIAERYPDSVLSQMQKTHKSCLYCGFITKTAILTSSTENQELTNLGSGYISGTGTIKHQYINKWTCSKFGFEVVTNNDFRADDCSSYIPKEEYEKKCLRGEMDKEKAKVQIIVDFSSLKDEMSKGGIVMSAYNCPKCSAMVDLPETGKILICKYCGTPIKPVDIFEQIKSLIE